MYKQSLKISFLVVLIFLASIPYSLYSPGKSEAEKEADRLAEIARLEAIENHKNFLTGRFEPETRVGFVKIPLKYALTENPMYLQKETLEAFGRMHEEAKKSGVTLLIASATRNFDYQKLIWERKWDGRVLVDGKKLPESTPDGMLRFQKILEYSAAPGSSRHHWGTDIDINGADVAYFNTKKGINEYNWLVKNASVFGFCQTYNKKDENRPNGYNEEKWHWSYTPLAKTYTQDFKELIKPENIYGFLGEEYVKDLHLIEDYVLGINPLCL